MRQVGFGVRILLLGSSAAVCLLILLIIDGGGRENLFDEYAGDLTLGLLFLLISMILAIPNKPRAAIVRLSKVQAKILQSLNVFQESEDSPEARKEVTNKVSDARSLLGRRQFLLFPVISSEIADDYGRAVDKVKELLTIEDPTSMDFVSNNGNSVNKLRRILRDAYIPALLVLNNVPKEYLIVSDGGEALKVSSSTYDAAISRDPI
ncbi:hypothetical protein [Parvularcula marina]|uniref:Uncharacterized protein n=1 Tax=Parvularcula marina TaxID=2292771 RepID=A0A371RFC2_9PROT|nr:hypothetical protein [Parvularcula marina]RFB04147.1 hypothetical protein DX908_01935 [Parvularcula marina]